MKYFLARAAGRNPNPRLSPTITAAARSFCPTSSIILKGLMIILMLIIMMKVMVRMMMMMIMLLMMLMKTKMIVRIIMRARVKMIIAHTVHVSYGFFPDKNFQNLS